MEAIADPASTTVADIMTTPAVTVEPETAVEEIAGLMNRHGFSGLPVVDSEDRLLGLVTELDLVVRYTRLRSPPSVTLLEATIYLESPRHFRERIQHTVGMTAREVMTAEPVTISPGATLEQLAELIVERKANLVPVVEGERLVGIVAAADLVRLLAKSTPPE